MPDVDEWAEDAVVVGNPLFCQRTDSAVHIFLPRFAQARKSYDISKLLSIGPTAWDASEENGMAICVGDRVAGLLSMITALVSAWPNGFCPLNMKFARPSQKFRWLNTALIVVGVLRGSTRRMLAPWIWKVSSKTIVPLSSALPGITLRNLNRNTPCEPVRAA